jgi:phenylpropionate dioxygenase-like ring-hydroxylating dioxygenase large terminal subunit
MFLARAHLPFPSHHLFCFETFKLSWQWQQHSTPQIKGQALVHPLGPNRTELRGCDRPLLAAHAAARFRQKRLRTHRRRVDNDRSLQM